MADVIFITPRASKMTNWFAKALTSSIFAHEGQRCEGTDIGNISHSMAVVAVALEHVTDEDHSVAQLLNDAVEVGSEYFANRICTEFGEWLGDIVKSCTDGVQDVSGQKNDRNKRKTHFLDHLQHANSNMLLVNGFD